MAQTNTLKERPDKLLDKIIKTTNSRAKKDINQWRSALQQAENIENPKRILLYNLYSEILLDADLSADMEKRILNVLGTEFNILDENGKIDAEKTKLINKNWFGKTIRYAMESIFWGHSLIEIDTLNSDGTIFSVQLVPRRHVVSEKGLILIRQNDEKGISYRDEKSLIPFLFEIGEKDNLGLINKCCPHVMYQRFAQAAWSEFCELFGMPVRYAKTNTKDKESLNRLEQMLIDMATASYAVIDKDEELEFIETAKSNGDVYERLIKVCSNKISKLVLGSVIGESSDNGSRAKEQVGLEIQQEILKADLKWIEDIVNESIFPKLIALGYPFEKYTFSFLKAKDIETELKIANIIMQHYEVPIEYITETFGIPVSKQKSSSELSKHIDANNGLDFFD